MDFSASLRSVKRCVRSNIHLLFRAILCIRGSGASVAVKRSGSGISNLGFLYKGAISFIGGGTFRKALLTRASKGIPGLVMELGTLSRCALNRLMCFFRGTYNVDNCILKMGPFGRPKIRDCGGGVFTLLKGPKFRSRGTRLRRELGWFWGGYYFLKGFIL